MKRKIELNAGRVRIVATLNTDGLGLTREEVERVRDDLADALQEAPARVRYLGIARSRVKVK